MTASSTILYIKLKHREPMVTPEGVKSLKSVEECKDPKIMKDNTVKEIEAKKSFEDLCMHPEKNRINKYTK